MEKSLSPAKTKLYHQDGTGRDTYIGKDGWWIIVYKMADQKEGIVNFLKPKRTWRANIFLIKTQSHPWKMV